MKTLIQFLFALMVMVPSLSFAFGTPIEELSREELIPLLQDMSTSNIDSLLQKMILDGRPNVDVRNINRTLVMREHLSRIFAEPATSISADDLLDKNLNAEYRKYLFHAYGASVSAMSETTLSQIVTATQQVILDSHETESMRISALRFSDEFFQAALDIGVLSRSQFDDITKMYMDIVVDTSETSNTRIAGLWAIRSLGLRSEAQRLMELFVSGGAGEASLGCRIITLLGEWKYQSFLPVATSVLESANDQKFRDSAAYALNRLSVFEIVRPLVDCIERKQDSNFLCRNALNNNAGLISEALRSGDEGSVALALQASKYVRGNPDELISSLTQLLDSSNSEIALSAVKRIARSGDPQILTTLQMHRQNMKNPRVRKFLNMLQERMIAEIHLIPNIAPEGKGDRPSLEVADAVYRDKGSLNYNHAALYIGYNSTDLGLFDEIIQASMDIVHVNVFSTIWNHDEHLFQGAYELSGLDFQKRQDIIVTAKDLVIAEIPYVNNFTLDALDYSEDLGDNTRIAIEYIDALRCDGTVEYCYEYNDNDVWDQATTDGDHFDISHNKAWADEHNDSPELNVDCEKEFSPLAQRNADSCSGSNTNFQFATSAPPEVEYNVTGAGLVTVTATDTHSGIYCIEYKLGEGDEWTTSEIQGNYPENNSQSVLFSVSQDTILYVKALDNAGNWFVSAATFIDIDEAGACPVDNFSVRNGLANWTVLDEEGSPRRYHVFSSINGYSGQWVEIGQIPFSGIGTYEICVETCEEDMIYRLKEESSHGEKEIAATYIPNDETEPPSPPSFKNEHQLREILASQLGRLKNSGKGAEEKDDIGTQCVIYCPPQFFDDLQSYLVFFWENNMGVDVELVDVGAFPSSSNEFRAELKSSIRGKAEEGIELFHLIGDASEWEEVAEMDPAEFPFSDTIQPERDLIPTFYLYDSSSLAWGRPFYSSDFPYSDIDNDGLPDVVVTRWPVATTEELLPRISKVISYNQHRGGMSYFSGMGFLALIQDIGTNGNSGELAEEVALYAVGQIPEQANVDLTIQRNSQFDDGYNVPQVTGLWNDLQPECLFMWSPHSYRRRPNSMLDNSATGLEPGYPSLVVAANCLTADFSRTDGESSFNDLAADTYCRFVDRGSIAWVGPTAVSYQRVNKAFTGAFTEILFSHPDWTMAKAWLAAVREILADSGMDQTRVKNVRSFAFLGDPLSRLERRFHPTFVAEPPAPTSDLFYASPNPFNPTTSVFFSVKDRGQYTVEVFDIRGRKIKCLFSGIAEPTAKMEIVWNGDNEKGGRVSSGTYFIRLKSDSGSNNILKVAIVK